MRLEVTTAEAREDLRHVPVCIGCGRPARFCRRQRLRIEPRRLSAGSGAFGGAHGIVAVLLCGIDLCAWARAPKAVAWFPLCRWHRWIVPPGVSLQSLTDTTLTLEGVHAEFIRLLRNYHSEKGTRHSSESG